MELLPDDVLGSELFSSRGLSVADLVSVSRTCKSMAARVRSNPAWLLGPRVKLECIGIQYQGANREPCPAFEVTLTSEYPARKLAYVPESIVAFHAWVAMLRAATPAVSLRLDVDRLDLWPVICALSARPLTEIPRFCEIKVGNRIPEHWYSVDVIESGAILPALSWVAQAALYSPTASRGAAVGAMDVALRVFSQADSVSWRFQSRDMKFAGAVGTQRLQKCIRASACDAVVLRRRCRAIQDPTPALRNMPWRIEYHSGFVIGGYTHEMHRFEPIHQQRDMIEAAFGADLADKTMFERVLTAHATLPAERQQQLRWDARPVVTTIDAVRRVHLRAPLPMGACRFAPQNRTLDKLYIEVSGARPGRSPPPAVFGDTPDHLWRTRTLVIEHQMSPEGPWLSWLAVHCFMATAPARRVKLSMHVPHPVPVEQASGLSLSARTVRSIRIAIRELGEFVLSGRIDKTARIAGRALTDSVTLEYCGEMTLEQLEKALPRMSWIYLGEALVRMQQYILEALPIAADEQFLRLLSERQEQNPFLAAIDATRLHAEWYRAQSR